MDRLEKAIEYISNMDKECKYTDDCTNCSFKKLCDNMYTNDNDSLALSTLKILNEIIPKED